MIIDKIKPMSLAKVTTILYGIAGAIFGLFLTIAQLVAPNPMLPQGLGGFVLGVGAIIVFPVIYAAIGFVSSLMMAILYNLVAKKFGGIEVDLH